MMIRAMAGFGAPSQPGFAQYAPPSVLAALAVGALVSTPLTGLRIPDPVPLGIVLPAARAGMLALLLILSAASLADGTYNPFMFFRF